MTTPQVSTLLNHSIYPATNSDATERPPLIILHGLLGSKDNWRGQAKRLAVERTVITVDLRNHGESPHLKGMSYREMYEDVLALAEQLALPRFDCLGHSMGGKVAMQMALSAGDKLNKLIVVDIAPRPYPLWHQSTIETVLNAPVAELGSRQAIDDYLQDSIEDATERGFMIKNLRRATADDTPSTGFRWKCNIEEIARGYLKISGFNTAGSVFNNPTLFLRGGDSPYVRPQDHALIHALFPQATIESIENAGHLPHFQQADEFYTQVTRFLQ